MRMPTASRSGHMTSKTRPSFWSHLYVQFLAVGCVLLVLEVLLTKVSLVEPRVSDLNELQKRRLDIYIDLTKLLITASGVTIGAITGFVLNRDKSIQFSPSQLRKIVASWGLAGVSMYCGYLSIQQVIWMLSVGFFDLYEAHLWLPSRLQFLTLLASIAVFADFIHGSLNKPEAAGEQT